MVKLKFQKRDVLLENPLLVFTVWNKDVALGYIIICPKWNKNVWCQEPDVQMSKGCLQQVIDKM